MNGRNAGRKNIPGSHDNPTCLRLFGKFTLVFLFLIACGAPLAAQSGQTAQPMPAASGQDELTATALTLADPSTFPAVRSEREKIEAAILRGDPPSLDNADVLIGKSRMLTVGELGTLKAAVAVFRETLYPDSLSVVSGGAPLSPFSTKGLSTRLADLLASLPLFGPDGALYSFMALEAVKTFEAAGIVSIYPALFRGKAFELAGDQAAATAQYRMAIMAFPAAWPAALGLVRCRMSMGLYADAAAAVDSFDPGFGSIPQALALSSEVLHENARLSEAYVLASRHLEYVASDSRSRMIRAHYLVESGEYPIALGILAALPKPESSTRLYFELRSLVSQGMKNIEDMLLWARRGLDMYPDDPGLLVLAAKALYSGPESGARQAGSYAERALAVLGVATPILATPAVSTPILAMPILATPDGTASAAEGTARSERFLLRNAGILSPLEKARLAKASREASGLLIVASTSGSNWNDALAYMDLAGQISVDRRTQSSILRNSGRIADAILYSQTWYREEPESGDALEAWLRSLAMAGRMEEVRNIVSGVPSGGGTSHQRAYLLYLKGRLALDPAEAMRSYRDALFEESNNVDALVALAEVHLMRKERERSLFYYNQAAGAGTVEKELSLRLAALKDALDSLK